MENFFIFSFYSFSILISQKEEDCRIDFFVVKYVKAYIVFKATFQEGVISLENSRD